MNPRVVLINDWPQPDTVTPASVVVHDSMLMVCYGSGSQYAVLALPCFDMKFGGPNDESLDGHPLYKFGLKHYSIHRIENSPWLHELERQNSVHPSHTKEWFLRDKVHYLFALKEHTLECISSGTGVRFEVFESLPLALGYLKQSVGA